MVNTKDKTVLEIKNNPSGKKKLVVIAIAVFAIAGIGAVYFLITSGSDEVPTADTEFVPGVVRDGVYMAEGIEQSIDAIANLEQAITKIDPSDEEALLSERSKLAQEYFGIAEYDSALNQADKALGLAVKLGNKQKIEELEDLQESIGRSKVLYEIYGS